MIHPNETDDSFWINTGCKRDAPDTDHCTLRDAITAVLPGDTVSLESPAPAGPYTISQDKLLIQKNITIHGLRPLGDNGGPTNTQALTAGSPGCPPPSTDQRGPLRPQGVACDIGAFELAQSAGGLPGGGLPATAALTAVKIKPSVFRAAVKGGSIARRRVRRTGTTISYRDSQAGTTTFTVARTGGTARRDRLLPDRQVAAGAGSAAGVGVPSATPSLG
jgi:hypothetical protein